MNDFPHLARNQSSRRSRLPGVGISHRLHLAEAPCSQIPWYVPVCSARSLVADVHSGGNIIVWGIILMLHASTSSFGAFFALRFLLGTYSRCICSRHDLQGLQACASAALHRSLFSSFRCSTRRMNRSVGSPDQVVSVLPEFQGTRISWFYVTVCALTFMGICHH